MARRGRPPASARGGDIGSRDRIQSAAATLFGELGYCETSLRRIGEAAGVDAALVNRHFGGKAQLFLAAIRGELGGALDRADEDRAARLQRAICMMFASAFAPSDVQAAVLREIVRAAGEGVEPIAAPMSAPGARTGAAVGLHLALLLNPKFLDDEPLATALAGRLFAALDYEAPGCRLAP